LFEYEFVLEFVVFGPAESDACFVEVFLHAVAVVLQPVHLPPEEVYVVFGGRFVVDAVCDLLLQVAASHNGNIINY
jgi:hypothetical protein